MAERIQWEYLEDEDLPHEELNARGAEGWELVSSYSETRHILIDEHAQLVTMYVFKRRLEGKDDQA